MGTGFPISPLPCPKSTYRLDRLGHEISTYEQGRN